MEDLVQLYNDNSDVIEEKLCEFDLLWDDADDDRLYKEMAFCMCLPNTSAKMAWKAVEDIVSQDKLGHGHFEQIAFILNEHKLKFHRLKTKAIVRNRNRYYDGTRQAILEHLNCGNIVQARNNIADSVHGFGMEEASHFLRNIGFGRHVCILDRHILRQLKDYGVISTIPNKMSKGEYIEIENDMRHFAQEVDIPIEALDLVLWYKAKSWIFK